MGFDIVSYAMGKAAGGGGKNAYASFSAPTSGEGSNGDYWFKLAGGTDTGYTGSLASWAGTPIAGWEFTATKALTVVGLRGSLFVNQSLTGYLKFGTPTKILAEVQTVFPSGRAWSNVYLDNPITLTPGTDYIVMIFGENQTLAYTNSSNMTFADGITYKQARYGSYPGSIEQGNIYSADIILEGEPPYQVDKQYYKSGGTWSVVT